MRTCLSNADSLIRRVVVGSVSLTCCVVSMVSHASDHADPIDPFSSEQLEGGITDLFVFPVHKNDAPANPYTGNSLISLSNPLDDTKRTFLTPEQRSEIDALVLILCVRRSLTEKESLALEPYKYVIHVDVDSRVMFPGADTTPLPPSDDKSGSAGGGYSTSMSAVNRITVEEAFLRYGGLIPNPEGIQEDLRIEFKLNNEAKILAGYPRYTGKLSATAEWADEGSEVRSVAGVYDDPFIFPAFFGTNVVAMAVRLPMRYFGSVNGDPHDLLIWATSHKHNRQVDHVGRSLRTQNPRFELLNTLHPSEHVAAIMEEHTYPSLFRDLAVRFNLQQSFAYRRWDFVPDVMIWTDRLPVGFPNGRLLNDDVAALLAQFGDTLLYELSYHNSRWPRQTFNDVNDQEFGTTFPYLPSPHEYEASLGPDRRPRPKPKLSSANRLKLAGIAGGLVLLLAVENWFVVKFYSSRKKRRGLLK